MGSVLSKAAERRSKDFHSFLYQDKKKNMCFLSST